MVVNDVGWTTSKEIVKDTLLSFTFTMTINPLTCKKFTLWGVYGVGFILYLFLFLSTASDPNAYITEIGFEFGPSGQLSAGGSSFSYQNLSKIRVSLAAFLLNYDQLGFFFSSSWVTGKRCLGSM